MKQNILKQQQRSKIRYDHHRQNPEYDLGTTVLIRIFTNRSKLDPKFFVEPKIIVDKDHPVYWIENTNTNTISRVHINDLRPLLIN
jgi:hypothetical protein